MITSWRHLLEVERAKQYWPGLESFVRAARAAGEVYPPDGDTFRALDLTPLETVAVVILGQDPYHGPGQAHGLSFSVPHGVPIPSSLRNIHRVLEDDLGHPRPSHGNLTAWAEQGVLLLNTVLTVNAGQPDSHRARGWEHFTDAVITAVNDRPDPVVFMLWGARAQQKREQITSPHHVMTSSHPSGLSAHRTAEPFMTSAPFSRANDLLTAAGRTPIDWNLTGTSGPRQRSDEVTT